MLPWMISCFDACDSPATTARKGPYLLDRLGRLRKLRHALVSVGLFLFLLGAFTVRWVFGQLRRLRSAPFTVSLCILLLAVHTVTYFMPTHPLVEKAIAWVRSDSGRFPSGEWWRPFTSTLLHFDWDHVLGNCWALLLFGYALERRFGTVQTASVYLLGAIGAGCGELTFAIHGIGASGAVLGLMGAYLVHPVRCRENGSLALVPGWLVAAWWVHTLTPSVTTWDLGEHISHMAHMGGLITGLCVGALMIERDAPPEPRWTRSRRFAVAAVASMALIAALAPDPRWGFGWHRAGAIRAEAGADFSGASRHWEWIEDYANTGFSTDPELITRAARFRFRRGDYAGARRLMSSVVTLLERPNDIRDAGLVVALCEPRDERTALRRWRYALHYHEQSSSVLDAMAQTILYSEDSSLCRPAEAREFAERAVKEDGEHTASYIYTLACTEYGCGDVAKAVDWVRRANTLDSTLRKGYASEEEELEWEFVAPAILHVFRSQGADSGAAAYLAAKSRHGGRRPREDVLNTIGYQLLEGGRPETAIAAFALNTLEYPASSDAFDSLGEGYMRHGDTRRAIEEYQRAVQLDSTNASSKLELKALRAGTWQVASGE